MGAFGSANATTAFHFRAYTLAVEYQGKLSMVMNRVGFPVLARTSNAVELAQLHRQMVRLLTIVTFPLLVLLVIGASMVTSLVGWLRAGLRLLFGPERLRRRGAELAGSVRRR
jgi:O-antigen/teichoic acid export membrane protein